MAALFVDNHAKEVWSSLYTKAGKVSHRNRVMPCITTTYVHTGAGTPLVLAVQSGAAPLAPRLVDLVEQAEKELETEVARAVVIDAEGSTFDILESFSRQGRVIVTPLKPSRHQSWICDMSEGPTIDRSVRPMSCAWRGGRCITERPTAASKWVCSRCGESIETRRRCC